jgi:hypothetical protein
MCGSRPTLVSSGGRICATEQARRCCIERMNRRIPLCNLALSWLPATALSRVGCRRSAASTPVPTTAQTPTLGTAGAAWEYKTVELQESPDGERAMGQMKEAMQEFRREGWLVLRNSQPLPQPDGTTHRKYALKRAKQ